MNDENEIDLESTMPAPRSLAPRGRGALVQKLVPPLTLVALALFTIAVEYWKRGTVSFVHPDNLINVVQKQSFIGIIAIGMTFVITLGGIDLSVGSLIAFLGGVGILLMNKLLAGHAGEGIAIAAGCTAMLAGGIIAGILNGLVITWGRVPSFIATLGGLAIYRSLAMALVNGSSYNSDSAAFSLIGADSMTVGGMALPVRWSVVALLVLVIVAAVVLNRTRYGRYVIAIGSNERAAIYSAINVRRVKIATYALMGGCVGVAAIMLASYMNSISSAQSGGLYELDAIAAVVIGGTRMRGGSGTIVGTLVGVLILGVIGNMLNILQVSIYYQDLVKGLIIVGAALMQRAEEKLG